MEFPSKLKKLEKPHEQDIIQLYQLIEKVNTEIQILKAENLNLRLLFQDRKKENQDLISKVQFQIEALTSQFELLEKNLEASQQKIKEEIRLPIKKNQLQSEKMEIEKMQAEQIFNSSPQQNVAIVVKRQNIFGGNVQSEEECLSSTVNNLEHQGGYIVTTLEVFTKKLILDDSSVTLIKQDLGNQQQQNQQLQKDNNDLRICLEKLEKNYKKMEIQFYELIEEKEELSQFEIDSDEDMYS